MTTMHHKGYTARIKFDERDSIFVGRIVGLRAIVSFHGATVMQLRKAFRQAVDDLLLDRCHSTRGQRLSSSRPSNC